ncbi:MAG: hypothetical protein FWD61_20330, partial [Phycisphaerales bacterium]|nr:hypothetical protein [Phycisphaerales bacterium]
MTQTLSTSPSPDAPPVSRSVQRQSLDQIVRLSIECAAEEQKIEQQHTEALDQETREYQKTANAQQHRYTQRRAELSASTARQQDLIQKRYDTRLATLESQLKESQHSMARHREESDAALKKKRDESAWQAEAALVSIEMQSDVEEKKTKQELELRMSDVKTLDQSVRAAVVRFKSLRGGGVESPFDDAAKARIAAEPRAMFDQHRKQAAELLKQLQSLAQVRFMASMVPVVLLLVAGLVCGGVAWMLLPHETLIRLLYIGGGFVALLILAALFYRHREQTRVRTAVKDLYSQIMQSLAIMRHAAKSEYDALADARERHLADARRKSSHDRTVSREHVKTLQHDALEQYHFKVEAMAENYKEQLAAIEQEKESASAELRQAHNKIAAAIEEENANQRRQTESQHTAALQTIAANYQSQSTALAQRWDDGLKAVATLIAEGTGIDPALIDWNSSAWNNWHSPPPQSFSSHPPQIRFGEMKVDIAQIAEQVPVHLKLPDTFSVPAMLELPDRASLLVEADHAGRAASIHLAQMVMARLLTQMPAGRVKFTLFDPVGLGQSFAGFMHLADHDESLVGSRIWTESEHMEQRLSDLTEHMETVIQKYLRNE